METESSANESEQKAIQQIDYTAVPDWAKINEPPYDLSRREGEPITQLLLDIQYDVGSKASFVRSIQRLENKQAVQELSQWRMNFDPKIQQIQLHHIHVIRDGVTREYATPDRLKIIQREEDLDSYILHGEVTLLVVLEDIRIGDILEVSYTRTTKPKLLPNHFSFLQAPPNSIRTGLYHLSVRFPVDSPIRWKSGNSDQTPKVSTTESHTCWTWEHSNIEPIEPENNIPTWELPNDWIQVSDMQDWSELANAAHEAWPNIDAFELPESLRDKIASLDLKETTETFIRYVQDEFRYLSVKTALGGQIPNEPYKVIERCYGDCKDLCCLLTHLLKTQSIPARAILVNSNLGKRLPELLPSGALFDHVIVEYQIDGESYWVDPTLSDQGGHATGRFVPDFEYGLAIQSTPTELLKQPSSRTVSDRYKLHDTIMLDTAGNPSILRVSTHVTGKYADSFRAQLAHEGAEGFIKSSTDRQKDRYTTECSLEPVKYKDDRKENVWSMIELYKIDFFKSMNSNNKFLQLALPPTLAMTAVPIPEEKDVRTCAYAIPKGLDVTHIVEIRSKTNKRLRTDKKSAHQHGIQMNIECIYKSEIWTQTTHLSTSSDHVAADETESLRKFLTKNWEKSGWVITAPRGVIRLHRPSDFGDWPKSNRDSASKATDANKPEVKTRKRVKVKPQRLASHPDEILKREQQEKIDRRNNRRQKESHPDERDGFLKTLAFWKK